MSEEQNSETPTRRTTRARHNLRRGTTRARTTTIGLNPDATTALDTYVEHLRRRLAPEIAALLGTGPRARARVVQMLVAQALAAERACEDGDRR